METLRVFAPKASLVEVLFGEERLPMTPAGDGYFELESPRFAPGARYALSIDGGPGRPDPRSRFQPDGVHAPSEWVEHAAYRWNTQGFRSPALREAVLYELHVGTFSSEGTFDGAAARLGALASLGVSHVEVMPIAAFPGSRGWGYDGVSPFAPHASYGGPLGFKRFVDACHGQGLAVILDVVYNHLGPSGNYLGQFGPYFASRYRTPWGEAINFDSAGSDEVRRFFVDNLSSWYRDYQVDGLRLDAVHTIFDQSAVHFLESLAERKRELERELDRPLVLIAESDLNDPRLVRDREAGGYGLDAAWCDDLHHALHGVITGERSGYYADFGSIAQVAKALRQGYVFDGGYSTFRGRRHGRSPAGLSGDRFVVCLQNHDQVGNRAVGDRLTHVPPEALADRLERVKAAAALLILSPFVPLVFQGEEWASSSPFPYFTDFREPELADAVRRGRRAEFVAFGWHPDDVPDPQGEETFARAKLDWSERSREPHRTILAFYQHLIGLRREHPGLRDPALDAVEVGFDEGAGWVSLRRSSLLVIANFGNRAVTLYTPARAAVLLASSTGCRCDDSRAYVPGPGVAVLEVAPHER